MQGNMGDGDDMCDGGRFISSHEGHAACGRSRRFPQPRGAWRRERSERRVVTSTRRPSLYNTLHLQSATPATPRSLTVHPPPPRARSIPLSYPPSSTMPRISDFSEAEEQYLVSRHPDFRRTPSSAKEAFREECAMHIIRTRNLVLDDPYVKDLFVTVRMRSRFMIIMGSLTDLANRKSAIGFKIMLLSRKRGFPSKSNTPLRVSVSTGC